MQLHSDVSIMYICCLFVSIWLLFSVLERIDSLILFSNGENYFRLRTMQCSNRLLESYIRRTRHHCTFHTNINFLSCSESGLLSIDKAVSIMYISVCLHTRECLSNNLHRCQTPTFTASLHLELQGLCQWLTLL